MGLIAQDLWFVGRRGRKRLRALFDSGSNHCLMSETVAGRLSELDDLPEPKEYEAAVGSFTARQFVVADVVIRRKRLTTLFKVVSALTEDVILGADFLQSWHIRLDPRHHRFIVDPRALRLKAVGGRARRG